MKIKQALQIVAESSEYKDFAAKFRTLVNQKGFSNEEIEDFKASYERIQIKFRSLVDPIWESILTCCKFQKGKAGPEKYNPGAVGRAKEFNEALNSNIKKILPEWYFYIQTLKKVVKEEKKKK